MNEPASESTQWNSADAPSLVASDPGRRLELIGNVAARYLRERLATGVDDPSGDATANVASTGTARFIVDCLSAVQTAAIARAILADSSLSSWFDIRLPRAFMRGMGMPDHVLTDERATYYRNATCDRPALLLANTGDDEEQSLRDLTSVSAPDLQAKPSFWVDAASVGLPLTPEHKRWWERALAGLQDLRSVSLDRFADYVVLTRQRIEVDGLPIVSALGTALPALRLPRDSNYFNAIAERFRTHSSKWRGMFVTAQTKRACFLSKQTATGTVLGEDELRSAFVKVRESIPEIHHAAIAAFLDAPAGWTSASAALAEREWEDIKPLFDGLRRERFNLGQATLDFFGERDPSLLSDSEKDYLRRLISRRTTEAELDDDRQFHAAHRDELREDQKLKSAWDRFVLGPPRETRDFLSGLAGCIEGFNWDGRAKRRTITIRCERRFKKDLRDLNVDAGLFFSSRYAGLRAVFGREIRWEVGDVFRFAELVEEWRVARRPLTKSEAKAALQLKFVVELEVENDSSTETFSTQFVWKHDPQWVPCEFAHDWSRLVAHPLMLCRANREPTNDKGVGQSVDLWNVRTLMAAYGQDRGSFVGTYRPENDLALVWRENLREAVAKRWVPDEAATRLLKMFDAFATLYERAITEFLADGVSAASVEPQLAAFGALLEALCREAKGDRARSLLLRPILQLGTVAIDGGRPTAIVTPWHPLRLAAMSAKIRRLKELVHHLATTPQIEFGDPRLFFRDLREELSHPFYPEVVLGWSGEKAELLSLADTAGDYTLHESPIAGDSGADDTNENPTEGALRVVELVRRYIALQPHEQANLAIVLYNSDSSRLPMAVVDKLGALHEDDEDVRCQVVLRHRDPKQLRSLYEQIVESADSDSDAFVASEAARDFMARLRIGIMADQAPPPDPRDGCPQDIVFSQDVIARHAQLAWYPVGARPEHAGLNPAQWSRRRPAATGDMKSVVYLSCPVQRSQGWAFLTAIATFAKGDWDGDASVRFLPARQLDFQDPTTARILDETHNLGTWVVNFDELLDRRQLIEQHIRVIRYKQSATQGKNLVISSRAPLGLLQSMVLGRLRDLQLGLPEASLTELAERFINDANDISGDIVLRAAKRGRSASELLGLVLSRYLLRYELGPTNYTGWYFLDDYAAWLGQREEQIADLMALSTSTEASGRRKLLVILSEAKYIDVASLADKRRESQKQLRDTLRRIAGVVLRSAHSDSTRLDRNVWLARLSDLLVDGVRFPAGASLDLPEWRRAIRAGDCDIEVRGYSHIFVPSPGSSADVSVCIPLEGTAEDGVAASYQEVFTREHVRGLVLSYYGNDDPTSVRRDAGGDGWRSPSSRRPDILLPFADVDDTRDQGRADKKSEVNTADVPPDGGDPLPSAPEMTSEQASVGSDADRIATNRGGTPLPKASDSSSSSHGSWAFSAVSTWVAAGVRVASETKEDVTWLRETEATTKGALQQFHLQAKLVRSALTPNAALLKFQGTAQLTVDQVLRRRSEFLTTYGLNIVGIQPEPGIVALSIARPRREMVSLRTLWRRWSPPQVHGNQVLLIGVREDDGGLLELSPGQEHAPHTLIAGSTGSGKSVLMQNIILSIAATNLPSQARVILIDPKQGVDYFAFDGLPHLEHGIIDRQQDALARINALVTEMDARYVRLRKARVSNLRAYNEQALPEDRMPVLWFIHDEFAEWMLADDYKEQVTATVARLGVKARAAGIHLVFAAQRPEASVMPMQLRANLGNRLILRVDSEGTSEIALGERGAERLLGRGHVLAKLEGASSLVYAQVPFATPDEIAALVDGIRAEAEA